jgi:hypothetical protein
VSAQLGGPSLGVDWVRPRGRISAARGVGGAVRRGGDAGGRCGMRGKGEGRGGARRGDGICPLGRRGGTELVSRESLGVGWKRLQTRD